MKFPETNEKESKTNKPLSKNCNEMNDHAILTGREGKKFKKKNYKNK